MTNGKKIPEFSKTVRDRYPWPPGDPPYPYFPVPDLRHWPKPWPPGDYLHDIYELLDERMQDRVNPILAKHRVEELKIQQNFDQQVFELKQSYDKQMLDLRSSTLKQIEKALG
jgi:hypothetical protein